METSVVEYAYYFSLNSQLFQVPRLINFYELPHKSSRDDNI